MHYKKLKNQVMLASFGLFALQACGGSSPVPIPPPITEQPEYSGLAEPNSSPSTANSVAVYSDGSASQYITTTEGSYNHTTDLLQNGNGAYEITDLAEGYDYALSFNQSVNVDGSEQGGFHIGGIITSQDDMPPSTHAAVSYSGRSSVFYAGEYEGETHGHDLAGDSEILVDFAQQNVHLTLDNFTQLNNSALALPFDEITYSHLSLNGNGFEGMDPVISANGANIDLTGANSNGELSGLFFGWDESISAPDEAGGVFLVTGEDGEIIGRFVAD